MPRKKVLVGISGGVDSAVVAALLQDQGYEVAGVYVEAYNEPGCRTDQDKKDALQVAIKLGIPFISLDLRKEYKEKVVQYFLDEYRAGRTPNPDIVCNREVKFGLLYDYMIENGYDYLATGHYSRIVKTRIQNSEFRMNGLALQRPRDLGKDQTYFLWQVGQDKLARVLFPLGELMKKEVRVKARELGLPNADKPDSMGVCMIGELNVGVFLREKLGTKRGAVKWKEEEIGRHEGLWLATVGERGGWTIDPQKQTPNMPALYVVGKDLEKNELIVGERGECFTNEIRIQNLELRIKEEKLWVRIRNLGELTQVKQRLGNVITLEQPVFAPAPGQSAVFYTEDGVVAGGGIIG